VFYQLFGATGENNVKLSHCRFREHFKTFPRARTVDTTQKNNEKKPTARGDVRAAFLFAAAASVIIILRLKSERRPG